MEFGSRIDTFRTRRIPSSVGVPVGGLVAGLVAGLMILAAPAAAQDRPEVHTDFRFGTLPYDLPAMELLSDEESRRLIVALSRGWNVDKFVKETETRELSVLTLLDDLEDEGLIRGDSDENMRPAFPIFREEDLEEALPLVDEIATGLAALIEEHWNEVEAAADSFEAGGTFARDELLYRVVVGGVLFGGMTDVLYDDKTLVPSPPRRRGRSSAFYAWMVEGAAFPAPLVYDVAQVGRYGVYSIGPVAPDESRVEIAVLGETDPVFDDQDARRWRIFASVFSRDYVLPYLKSHRQDMLDVASELRVSRYTAFAEFVAWVYLTSASETARMLTESGHLSAPETSFRYALRLDR